MTQRRPPRALRREPFPPADDYEEPLVDVDEEPFPLRSEYVPTMRDLSEQVGAVSAHLTVVHREAALARASAEAARGEIAEVRKLVIGDHAPRLTEVDRRVNDVEKRVPITIPPGLRKGAAKGAALGAVAAAWPLLEWLIPLVQELASKAGK